MVSSDEECAPDHFDCRIEQTDNLLLKIKQAYGLGSSVTNIKWVYKLARGTDNVQDQLEAVLGANESDLGAICLTNEGLEAWLKTRRQAPACGAKRALADGDDGDDTDSPKPPVGNLSDLLYEAVACSMLWEAGVDWLQVATGDLEEKADKARERGTEKGDERAEKYDDLKDEVDRLSEEMEGLYGDGPEPMLSAIIDGDVDAVLGVLGNGTFQLDIGTQE